MRTSVVTMVMIMLISISASAQSYNVDVNESKLEWLAEKVTGEHKGTISLQSGEFMYKDNKLTGGTFVIDMNSIVATDIEDAGTNAKFVGHLKSDDFFGVSTYPTATFTIKSSTAFTKGSAVVKGNLTIKGITKPIEFKANIKQVEGGLKFFANIIVDRTQFNIKYGSSSFFDNLADKTIYDEFKVKLNLSAKSK